MILLINMAVFYKEGFHQGGYTFWISSDVGGSKRSNILKEVLDLEDAYLQTVELALETLYKDYFGRITRLFIEVDSEVAVSRIRRSAVSGTTASRCYLLLRKIMKQHNLTFYQFSLPGKKNANHQWCSDMARRKWEEFIENN